MASENGGWCPPFPFTCGFREGLSIPSDRADEQNNSLSSSTIRGRPIGAARSLITKGERWLILHLLPPHIWPV
jgi:hypothetical protein